MIQSNGSAAIARLRDKLRSLEEGDKVLREAALSTVVLISDRVQQRGEKKDGTKITTSAKKQSGAYSQSHANNRRKKGRQTQYIDLTFSTGGMMDNLQAEPEGKTSYVVGFRGKEASQKAEWNEERFGDIFGLSDNEYREVTGIIERRVNDILR